MIRQTNFRRHLWCYRASRTRIAVGGALSDGGGLFRWLRESLNLETTDLELRLAALEPDSHGLTILPVLVRRTKHRMVVRCTRRCLWNQAGDATDRNCPRSARSDCVSVRVDRARSGTRRARCNGDRHRQCATLFARLDTDHRRRSWPSGDPRKRGGSVDPRGLPCLRLKRWAK